MIYELSTCQHIEELKTNISIFETSVWLCWPKIWLSYHDCHIFEAISLDILDKSFNFYIGLCTVGWSFPGGLRLCLSSWRICLQCGRPDFDPWGGKILWRREKLPTPVFWPENSMDCIVHGVAKSRTRLSDFHFHPPLPPTVAKPYKICLQWTRQPHKMQAWSLGWGRSPGGGHGNPLQYCCRENPTAQRSLAGHSL